MNSSLISIAFSSTLNGDVIKDFVIKIKNKSTQKPVKTEVLQETKKVESTETLWSKENPEPKEIKASEKNLEALKNYRLSGQTDEELLKKATYTEVLNEMRLCIEKLQKANEVCK